MECFGVDDKTKMTQMSGRRTFMSIALLLSQRQSDQSDSLIFSLIGRRELRPCGDVLMR